SASTGLSLMAQVGNHMRSQRSAPWLSSLTAIFLVSLALAVRLVPAWNLRAEVADIATYRTMAEIVLRRDNTYATPILFPYTPYSQFLPAWCLQFAEWSHWRFDFVVKLPSIAADAGTTLLIFGYLRWRRE